MNPQLSARLTAVAQSWRTWTGLLVLPVLVMSLFLWAFWSPQTNHGAAKAAVVNNDEPVTIDGQTIPLGRQLAANLTTSTAAYSWVLTDAADARDGLARGDYGAVVTIPEDFSARATSTANPDPLAAGQAEIHVQTSNATGVADPLVSTQIAEVVLRTLNQQIVSTYLDKVYLSFATIHDQIGKAADGAAQLAAGADKLSTGADQLTTGTGQLAGGLGQAQQQVKTARTTVADLQRQLEIPPPPRNPRNHSDRDARERPGHRRQRRRPHRPGRSPTRHRPASIILWRARIGRSTEAGPRPDSGIRPSPTRSARRRRLHTCSRSHRQHRSWRRRRRRGTDVGVVGMRVEHVHRHSRVAVGGSDFATRHPTNRCTRSTTRGHGRPARGPDPRTRSHAVATSEPHTLARSDRSDRTGRLEFRRTQPGRRRDIRPRGSVCFHCCARHRHCHEPDIDNPRHPAHHRNSAAHPCRNARAAWRHHRVGHHLDWVGPTHRLAIGCRGSDAAHHRTPPHPRQ